MGLHELSLAPQLLDVALGANAQVLIFTDKQAQLVAQVSEILVIGCGGEQEHVAVLTVDKRLDIGITPSTGAIAQVVAFIDDDEAVIA